MKKIILVIMFVLFSSNGFAQVTGDSNDPGIDDPNLLGPIIQYPSACLDSGQMLEDYYGRIMQGLIESGAGYKMFSHWTYDEPSNTYIQHYPSLPYRELWEQQAFDMAREMVAKVCNRPVR